MKTFMWNMVSYLSMQGAKLQLLRKHSYKAMSPILWEMSSNIWKWREGIPTSKRHGLFLFLGPYQSTFSYKISLHVLYIRLNLKEMRSILRLCLRSCLFNTFLCPLVVEIELIFVFQMVVLHVLIRENKIESDGSGVVIRAISLGIMVIPRANIYTRKSNLDSFFIQCSDLC